MMPTQKGLYKPKFPEKYKGNPCNIVFRSSWEYKLMKYFDLSGNIVQWQSEELWIPYRSPIDRKVHRYFPDFLICVVDKNGNKTTKIIEVKPKKQTIPPNPPKPPPNPHTLFLGPCRAPKPPKRGLARPKKPVQDLV